jgi:hypothetical protein
MATASKFNKSQRSPAAQRTSHRRAVAQQKTFDNAESHPINTGFGQIAALFGAPIAEAIGNALKSLDEPIAPPQSSNKSLADEKLELLVDGLQKIFRLPIQNIPESELHDRSVMELRDRYERSLYWLAKFFKMTGVGNDVAKYFADLAIALHGLKHGIVHPVLMADPPDNRPGDRSDVWRLRVLAANGLECLLRSNVYSSRQQAAAAAANKNPGLAKLLRSRGDTGVNIRKKISLASSLLSWRDAVAKKKVSDSVAAAVAGEFLEFIDVFAGISSSQQLANFGWQYLKSACDQAAKLL